MGVQGITEEAVPLKKQIKVSQTREKADEFGVHRLQNDLHEMPGMPKQSEKRRNAECRMMITNLGMMDSRLGKGV